MDKHFVQVLLTFDNISSISSAIAQALVCAFNGSPQPGVLPDSPSPLPIIAPTMCGGVTVTPIGTPSRTGSNQININLSVPTGTSDTLIEQFVTQVISNLNTGTVGYYLSWPAMGTVTIQSITVD
jgi:hypothetical protein